MESTVKVHYRSPKKKNKTVPRLILSIAIVVMIVIIVVLILSKIDLFDSAQKFGEMMTAETWVGTDIGEKVNKSLATLKDKKGVVKVTDSGKIKSTIKLSEGQVLEFGPGVWECAASPCISLGDASQVKGSGVYNTRLLLNKVSKGPIFQSKDFNKQSGIKGTELLKEKYPLDGDEKSLPGVKYIGIKDLTIDGRKIKHKAAVNGIEIFGFWYTLEDISVENFSGNGIVTEFIDTASVPGNDAMESYFTNIKLLNNEQSGWALRGPHDAVVSGLVSAKNKGWGVEVKAKEGYYSGSGTMFLNSHIYGNGNGLKVEPGANITAYGLLSESNGGVGILLESNDNLIQGSLFTNGSYGAQIGSKSARSGVNNLNIQAHNNKIAQVNWENSAGYNYLSGNVFPNDEKQKKFEKSPLPEDRVEIVGP